MMKRLQGRSLKHPGCLIGITTGLIVGIVLAGILAKVFDTPYSTLLLIWFGLTIGLGAIGWLIGASMTVPAAEEVTAPTTEPTVQSDISLNNHDAQ